MSLVDLGKRLLEAAKQGHTDDVRSLMSNGAPFTTDWLGTSPLHFAAMFGHSDTAEVLLRAGISRDARTKVDRTPLHVASQEGHLEIVELLIRNGADIEAKDMLKMTPLHWAVEKGHFAVIEVLIRQGADVSCENKFDKTPVDIAVTNGRPDIAEILQLHRQTVVEVSTEQQIVEEVTATETISSEVVDAEHTVLETTADGEIIHTEEGSVGEGGEQNSTAVLATLAALAEATGPLNTPNTTTSTTAAEALNWLETHGITMMSNSDQSTIVTSTLESGQNLTLTEAGKLALAENTVLHTEGAEEEGGDSQNVITIVTSDGQTAQIDNNNPVANSVVVTLAQDQLTSNADALSSEPAMKRIKIEGEEGETIAIATEGSEAGTIVSQGSEVTVEEQLVESHDLIGQSHDLEHEGQVYTVQLVGDSENVEGELTEITEES